MECFRHLPRLAGICVQDMDNTGKNLFVCQGLWESASSSLYHGMVSEGGISCS